MPERAAAPVSGLSVPKSTTHAPGGDAKIGDASTDSVNATSRVDAASTL